MARKARYPSSDGNYVKELLLIEGLFYCPEYLNWSLIMAHQCEQKDCKHDEVKFCTRCQKVYCMKCGKEWAEPCQLNHYQPQPIKTFAICLSVYSGCPQPYIAPWLQPYVVTCDTQGQTITHCVMQWIVFPWYFWRLLPLILPPFYSAKARCRLPSGGGQQTSPDCKAPVRQIVCCTYHEAINTFLHWLG